MQYFYYILPYVQKSPRFEFRVLPTSSPMMWVFFDSNRLINIFIYLCLIYER